MQTVVEMPSFRADADRLFTSEERDALVEMIAANPHCGVLVPGTGGIRKVRFGFGGRGKRGGSRVLYLFAGANLPVFLLAAFAKNEQADLTGAERAALGRTVHDIVSKYGRRP